TYSGYENKVKSSIEKLVENNNMQEVIQEIKIPMEEVTEIKNGEKKTSLKKRYPGYVFVKMVMNDETWYVVRNTRGVTGFVGPGSKPVPLTRDEMDEMGVEQKVIEIEVKEGDNIKIVAGPLSGFTAVVKAVSVEKQIVTATVSMLGRETPVDLEFNQFEII
ncbi:transcription termination/antitermination protein NusG, partial [Treponema sp. R6D11]